MEMDLGDTVNSIVDGYQYMQQNHRILSTIITSEITYVLGDVVSQLITDKKIAANKIKYTAALAPSYGLCLDALMKSGDIVGKYISNHPLAKAALGPNLFGNFMNTYFFVNNTVGEKNGYGLRKLLSHYGGIIPRKTKGFFKGLWNNIKERYIKNIPAKEYLYSVGATVTLWNGFQYLNYSEVPEHMRTPTSLAAGMVWMSIMSIWSLKGRRKVVKQLEDKIE